MPTYQAMYSNVLETGHTLTWLLHESELNKCACKTSFVSLPSYSKTIFHSRSVWQGVSEKSKGFPFNHFCWSIHFWWLNHTKIPSHHRYVPLISAYQVWSLNPPYRDTTPTKTLPELRSILGFEGLMSHNGSQPTSATHDLKKGKITLPWGKCTP